MKHQCRESRSEWMFPWKLTVAATRKRGPRRLAFHPGIAPWVLGYTPRVRTLCVIGRLIHRIDKSMPYTFLCPTSPTTSTQCGKKITYSVRRSLIQIKDPVISEHRVDGMRASFSARAAKRDAFGGWSNRLEYAAKFSGSRGAGCPLNRSFGVRSL